MNEHDRDTLFALVFGLLGVVCLLLMSCTTPDKPFPEGDEVQAPYGYYLHCLEYPDSIFCRELEE